MVKRIESNNPVPQATNYQEMQIGKTLYRVTSIYTGEKDLGKTLEQLAIRKVLKEIQQESKEV